MPNRGLSTPLPQSGLWLTWTLRGWRQILQNGPRKDNANFEIFMRSIQRRVKGTCSDRIEIILHITPSFHTVGSKFMAWHAAQFFEKCFNANIRQSFFGNGVAERERARVTTKSIESIARFLG